MSTEWPKVMCLTCQHVLLPVDEGTCWCALKGTEPEFVEVVPSGPVREALEEIAAVLGSGECSQNGCEGCSYEMQEVARIAGSALSGLGGVSVTEEERS